MTDRNALMADAYLTASAALDDPTLHRAALADLDFILANMRAPDGSFFHVWSDGRAQVAGLAADQVYLLNALIDAYQFSADEKYLAEARKLAGIVLKNFRADGSGLLVNRETEDASTVIAQAAASGQVFFDMPTPSVQATMAIATMKLALLTGDDSYSKAANELMASAPTMAESMLSNSVATVGLALEYRANGEATVAMAGPHDEPRAAALWKTALASYRPGKVVMRVEIGSRRRIDAGCGAGDVRFERRERSPARVRMRRHSMRDAGRDAGETRGGHPEIRRQWKRQDYSRQRQIAAPPTADVIAFQSSSVL